mgnify:CR=1 FL=1|jgi:hypothetical protein|tara:strand:+ start:356 stop:634 length:279 start_codon:yes stop_codon:yes gene_type:complete
MTVLEIMERAGIRDTNLAIAWIKDAVHFIESTQTENLKVRKLNLVKNQRDYVLPADLISINSVSVLDTEDDNKYKKIRRMAGEHYVTEDTNP